MIYIVEYTKVGSSYVKESSREGVMCYTGEKRVVTEHLQSALIQCWRHVPGVSRRKRVGVLISGSGKPEFCSRVAFL